jgi:type IV pilus assembly protein PilW
MFKQKGLSLVELMIAIMLGLILLTGVMQVFLSSKNVYSSQQALSRIQETGRMAMEFISRDIRMAGFMGCASRGESFKITNMLSSPTSVTYNFNESIRGYEHPGFPVASSKITQTIKNNTDVIAVRYAEGTGVYVTKNNDGSRLFVNNSGEARQCTSGTSLSGLCASDILVVTDCEKANVFQASEVRAGTGTPDDQVNILHAQGTNPGNAIAAWGGNADKPNTFSVGSQVLVAKSNIYFIANGVSGFPSLWQSSNGANLELLEGVEDMHITYGIDTEATPDFIPNEYKLAKDVTNWKQVVAVRIELLVSSLEDGVTGDHQVYTFPSDANATTTATDFRLRQIFTNTIALRNRIN